MVKYINIFGKGFYINTDQINTACTIILVIGWIITFAYYNSKTSTAFSRREMKRISKSIRYIRQSQLDEMANNKESYRLDKLIRRYKRLFPIMFSKTLKDEISIGLQKSEFKTENEVELQVNRYLVNGCNAIFYILIVGMLIGVFIHPVGFSFIFIVLCVPSIIRKIVEGRRKRLYYEIEEQMTEFVSTFYYKYRHNDSPFELRDFISDFEKRANDSFKKVLSKLRGDLDATNFNMAIDSLNSTFINNVNMSKFCSVCRSLNDKQDNASDILESWYDELKKQRDKKYEMETKKVEEISTYIVDTLVTVLVGAVSAIFIVNVFVQ